MSLSRNVTGREFQRHGPVTENLPSPRRILVLLVAHVKTSADRSDRWPMSVKSWQSSARYCGSWPCTQEQLAWSQCAVELVTSAAPKELVWYAPIFQFYKIPWTHVSQPLSHFCRAYPCDQHTVIHPDRKPRYMCHNRLHLCYTYDGLKCNMSHIHKLIFYPNVGIYFRLLSLPSLHIIISTSQSFYITVQSTWKGSPVPGDENTASALRQVQPVVQ